MKKLFILTLFTLSFHSFSDCSEVYNQKAQTMGLGALSSPNCGAKKEESQDHIRMSFSKDKGRRDQSSKMYCDIERNFGTEERIHLAIEKLCSKFFPVKEEYSDSGDSMVIETPTTNPL